MATKKARPATRRQAVRAKSIGLDEFTAQTYQAVLRAVEVRGLKRFPGPIIFGFIWYPDGPQPGIGTSPGFGPGIGTSPGR